MSELGLTNRQAKLLDFIEERLKTRRIAPTYREMRDYLGLKSTASIQRIVLCLVERGYVRNLPGRARSIKLSHDQPIKSFICPHCGNVAGGVRCRAAAKHLAALLKNAADLQVREAA